MSRRYALALFVALLAFAARSAVARQPEFAIYPEVEASGSELIVRGQNMPPQQLSVAQLSPLVVGPAYDGATSGPIVYVPPVGAPTIQTAGVGGQAPPSFRFGVFGDFLYLEARNADVPFAVPVEPISARPMGPVAVASPDRKYGFRAGAMLTMGEDAYLSGSYTRFTSSTNESINASGGNVIAPLVLYPGTFLPIFFTSGSATYDINFQLIDVDYHVMGDCCPDRFWYGYFVGARYGQLHQTFNANFPFAGVANTASLATTSNFNGVGPRLGVQGEHIIIPGRGLRAYGTTSANFLIGSFSTSYLQSNALVGTQVNTSFRDDRIVSILDLELGLSWASPAQRVRLSAGYMIAAWFNSINTSNWIQSVQNGSFQPGNNTITFDGLVARGELRF